MGNPGRRRGPPSAGSRSSHATSEIEAPPATMPNAGRQPPKASARGTTTAAATDPPMIMPATYAPVPAAG